MYVPWLISRILKSGFHVSRLILDPALPIAPVLVQHKTKLSSNGELVVLGNSITLTPGTITVEVAPGELLVHALDAASCEELKSGVFDDRVGRLFSVKEDKK
jgi:multicomponent Na+:H+ antiporter subunit E